MLALMALDPVDADPTAAWRGSAVHDVLEAWMKEDDCDPAKLRARAEALLDVAGRPPADARALAAAADRGDRLHRRPGRGQSARRGGGRSPPRHGARSSIAGVRLGGKADRIDRLADGGLAIVDYKTGQPPSEEGGRRGLFAAARPARPDRRARRLRRDRGRGGLLRILVAGARPSASAPAGSAMSTSPVGGRSGLDAAEFTDARRAPFHRARPRPG